MVRLWRTTEAQSAARTPFSKKCLHFFDFAFMSLE